MKLIVGFVVASLLTARLGAQDLGEHPFSGGDDGGRKISWGRLIPNILEDQAHIWVFPIELAKGRHVGPTIAFSFTTWTAIALDPADTPYFSRTQSFSGFNNAFTSTRTFAGVLAAPAALYVAGLATHSPYARDTSLLAFEAAGDAGLVDIVLKSLTRRLRPSDIAPNGDFTHSFYKYKGSAISGSTSFPSGHTITAFAVASVVAHRYAHRRWVPVVAYGLASVVGFSRVTLRAHFPSDVFAGGFLGYVIGRQVERGWSIDHSDRSQSTGGPSAPPAAVERPTDDSLKFP